VRLLDDGLGLLDVGTDLFGLVLATPSPVDCSAGGVCAARNVSGSGWLASVFIPERSSFGSEP